MQLRSGITPNSIFLIFKHRDVIFCKISIIIYVITKLTNYRILQVTGSKMADQVTFIGNSENMIYRLVLDIMR